MEDEILIRKYKNRKLYAVQYGTYVKFSDICNLHKEGKSIKVVNHSTNEDITNDIIVSAMMTDEGFYNKVLNLIKRGV